MLAFGFWFCAIAATAGLAYVLLFWLPQHRFI